MSVVRKIRLTWRRSPGGAFQARVFASEASARRFIYRHLTSDAVVTMEPFEGGVAARPTKRQAVRVRRPAAKEEEGACPICGRWRPAGGRGHDICDVRREEEARIGCGVHLPDGEPSPAWEIGVRWLEDKG